MENISFSRKRFKSNFFDKISHFSTLNFNLLSNNMFTISRRDKQVSEISIVKFKKKKVENKINFDNRDFDGQMLLSLDAEPKRLQCKGDTRYVTDNRIESALRTLLNLFVILICH